MGRLRGRPGAAGWWGKKFQLGRAPFDSKYCAAWHALFESLAPGDRALAPVYRFPLRARGAKLRGETAPDSKAVYQMAFDTVSQTIDLGASSAELGSVLRAYVEDSPPHIVETVAEREELVGDAGQLRPYGVIVGIVFSMVTRTSHGARLNWFHFPHWWKVSRMLRGLAPNAQGDKKFPMDARRGFEKIMEPEASDCLRALLPVQPDDKSRVWGVNSSAMSPMLGGVFREGVAQRRGSRTPASASRGKGSHSSMWLTVIDPDATVAAPGAAPHVKEEASGIEASTAHANAVILGRLFTKWFGNRTSSSKETQVLVDNVL